MTRTRAAVVALSVPALLALGACGGGSPASSDELREVAGPAGIAPELVRVTDVEGFDLVPQSVGVYGDDGMSAMYTHLTGEGLATVGIVTARERPADVVACDDLADDAAPGSLRCDVEQDGIHVVVSGEGVDAATVRAAAEAVRVPGPGELDHLFSEVPVAEVPVERGDLPPVGGGAPDNSVGAGG